MTRANVRRAAGEEGVALVTAMLVLLVAASLTVTVVVLSTHNSTGSAYDRNRLLAVNAAESGLDDFFATVLSSTRASCDPVDQDLQTEPVSHYHRTVVLYATWPPDDAQTIACPAPGGSLSAVPAGALVTSTGTAVATSTRAAKRTMESLVRLAPYYGGYQNAIFSNTGINLVNKLTANGYQGNDADVYTNGDFVNTNNITISGSIYAQGYADIANQTTVKEDVWANGSVYLHGSTTVYGRARSSTSWIKVDNPAHVYGSARAATTIGGSGTIDGAKITNSPAGAPPALPFPHLGYDPAAWTALGYTIHDYSDCTSALNFLKALPAGSHVIRISPACTMTIANNTTINLRGNVAIVMDGALTIENQSNWNGVDGGPWNLHLIRPWEDGLNCASHAYDISFSNNTNFSNVQLGVYTPCTANMENQNGQSGQIFGGTVNIENQMNFNFVPVLFPGELQVGYEAYVSYIREIVNP